MYECQRAAVFLIHDDCCIAECMKQVVFPLRPDMQQQHLLSVFVWGGLPCYQTCSNNPFWLLGFLFAFLVFADFGVLVFFLPSILPWIILVLFAFLGVSIAFGPISES